MPETPRPALPAPRRALLLLALFVAGSVQAGFELIAPDGRRVLLQADGTWRYVDDAAPAAGAASSADVADSAAAAASAASAPEGPKPMAELQLLRRTASPRACSFEFELTNTLPYEIRSLVPYFAVLRPDGVTYTTQSAFFGPLKPGDTIRRSLRFGGIECDEIARVQVEGGDRCEMGELNKFSDAKGECLARLKVLPSELVVFEK